MTATVKRFVGVVAVFCVVGSIADLGAQMAAGTWTRTDAGGAGMVMIVEPCCGGGYRLTYKFGQAAGGMSLTVESAFDGKDAPVMVEGKPSGETMALKKADALHATCVLKMNGQVIGTSKSSLSTDGKRLTVEDDFTSATGGQKAGKATETWIKK